MCIYNSGTNVYYINASFKAPGATLVPLSVGKACCILYICGISNLMACIPAIIIIIVISMRDLLAREGLYNYYVAWGFCW